MGAEVSVAPRFLARGLRDVGPRLPRWPGIQTSQATSQGTARPPGRASVLGGCVSLGAPQVAQKGAVCGIQMTPPNAQPQQ